MSDLKTQVRRIRLADRVRSLADLIEGKRCYRSWGCMGRKGHRGACPKL